MVNITCKLKAMKYQQQHKIEEGQEQNKGQNKRYWSSDGKFLGC
jgi:hypothetical protein